VELVAERQPLAPFEIRPASKLVAGDSVVELPYPARSTIS